MPPVKQRKWWRLYFIDHHRAALRDPDAFQGKMKVACRRCFEARVQQELAADAEAIRLGTRSDARGTQLISEMRTSMLTIFRIPVTLDCLCQFGPPGRQTLIISGSSLGQQHCLYIYGTAKRSHPTFGVRQLRLISRSLGEGGHKPHPSLH